LICSVWGFVGYDSRIISVPVVCAETGAVVFTLPEVDGEEGLFEDDAAVECGCIHCGDRPDLQSEYVRVMCDVRKV
jgi:hypothetical protein